MPTLQSNVSHRENVPLSQERFLVVLWDDVEDVFSLRLLDWGIKRFEFRTPAEPVRRVVLIRQVDSSSGTAKAGAVTIGCNWDFLSVELSGHPFAWGATSLYRSAVRKLEAQRRQFERRVLRRG